MITDEDTTKIVNKIIEANHKLFYDKLEMDEKFDAVEQKLGKKIDKLKTSVDAFAKITKQNKDESVVANDRLNSHEDWIKKAGSKIGLEFKP